MFLFKKCAFPPAALRRWYIVALLGQGVIFFMVQGGAIVKHKRINVERRGFML